MVKRFILVARRDSDFYAYYILQSVANDRKHPVASVSLQSSDKRACALQKNVVHGHRKKFRIRFKPVRDAVKSQFIYENLCI